jgi:hypothetical protein
LATDPKDPTTIEHQPVVDRVVEVSKNPDGSPAQREGFEQVDVDEETAGDEPEAEQVSGVVGSTEPTAPRRSRKRNVETATER